MKRVLSAVCILVVAACADTPDPTSLDLETTATEIRGGNGAGNGVLVTGSGHIFTNRPHIPGERNLREFTVNVVRKKDGSIGGTMHLGSVALRPGLAFIGEVTCATIIDNGDGTKDAFIGGTNRHTNFGGNDLGEQFGVRVRDGGSVGADAVSGVDFAGLVGVPNVGDLACSDTPYQFFGVFPIGQGQIKIR